MISPRLFSYICFASNLKNKSKINHFLFNLECFADSSTLSKAIRVFFMSTKPKDKTLTQSQQRKVTNKLDTK